MGEPTGHRARMGTWAAHCETESPYAETIEAKGAEIMEHPFVCDQCGRAVRVTERSYQKIRAMSGDGWSGLCQCGGTMKEVA